MRTYIEIVGTVTAPLFIKDGERGQRSAHLTVMTEEGWHDRSDGERHVRRTYHQVQVTKTGVVKAIERSVAEGDLVLVVGALRYSDWTDRDGVQRRTAEIAVRGAEHQLLFLGAASVAGTEASG